MHVICIQYMHKCSLLIVQTSQLFWYCHTWNLLTGIFFINLWQLSSDKHGTISLWMFTRETWTHYLFWSLQFLRRLRVLQRTHIGVAPCMLRRRIEHLSCDPASAFYHKGHKLSTFLHHACSLTIASIKIAFVCQRALQSVTDLWGGGDTAQFMNKRLDLIYTF